MLKIFKSRLFCAIFTGLVLFVVFSIARESLVPYNSDFNRSTWRLTGDEPAYLLTAQAIANGDGENVSHVHAAGLYKNYSDKIIIGKKQWNYSDYVKRCKVNFLIDRSEFWGDAQIQHGSPLMPLFASSFALSKERPRWKILLLQGIVASVVATFFVLLASSHNGNKWQTSWHSSFACIAFMGAAPIVWYTAQIYPEILIGLLLVLALLLARKDNFVFRAIGYFCLFLSLFGSSRIFAGVAIAALIYLVYSIRQRRWFDILVICLGFIAYFGYNLCLWGNFFPPNTDANSPITLSLIPLGFLRYFYGNSVGLFFLAPVAWVGFICLILLLRHPLRDSAILPCSALVFGISLSVAAFPAFRAGTCPAGRYQVAVAFLLLASILLYLGIEEKGTKWRQRVLCMLYGFGSFSVIMGVWLAANPSWWHRKYHPAFGNLRLQSYYDLLPDFSECWIWKLIAWVLVFVVLTFSWDFINFAYKYVFSRKKKSN